jgi:NADH:ubiquinone oxidoreductase subunit 6 (subunit J)
MESAGIIVAFWLLSAIAVLAALGVFLARNLIHAVSFLVLSFVATAGLFLTLSADFIAVAQVLIYAGAIPVLMVFAVMLTPLAGRDNGNSLYVVPGVVLGIAFTVVVTLVAIDVEWDAITGTGLDSQSFSTTADIIGNALLGRYVLAFEVASVLLLAALIGAIVLVREDEAA